MATCSEYFAGQTAQNSESPENVFRLSLIFSVREGTQKKFFLEVEPLRSGYPPPEKNLTGS